MQLKDSLFIIRIDKLHGIMCFVLVLSLVLQGFLEQQKIFGQPIWMWIIALFLPFLFRYTNFILNLNNPSLKYMYIYLFILCSSLALFNLFNLQDIRRALTLLAGLAVATIIFYGFRKNITSFIKLIIFLFIIQSVFSIIQFFFDLQFFDGFQRGIDECDITKFDCIRIVSDKGSSGTFGYPVPYGYFIATFIPILYPHILPVFQATSSKSIKSNFLMLLIIIGSLLSMQRGAILTSLTSVIFLNIFLLKPRFNLITLPLMTLIPFIIFKYISDDKILFSFNLLIDRWNDQLYWFATEEYSSHMYMLNLFSKFGSLGIFFIIGFYLTLIRLLMKHRKFNNTTLPKGVIFGSILSIISYQLNALFHNNGHFMLDVVGFISLGYFFALTYFIFENKDDSFNS